MKPPTIKCVSCGEFFFGLPKNTKAWLPDYEIGIRDDGIIVWRKRNREEKKP